MKFDRTVLKPFAAIVARKRAMTGLYDGTAHSSAYLNYCTHVHPTSGTNLIFTRDAEQHFGGWLKNPQFERCWHLSLSFFDPEASECAPKNRKLTLEWIEQFFGLNASKLWAEPPYSPQGRARDVWHYRLFCDEHWQPILPRGEVYSTRFTEIGWKSFSELQWLKEKKTDV